MPRRTDDQVALLLTVSVCIVVIATSLATLYVTITQPEQDVTRAADAVGRIVSVIVAALVGYMAGRAPPRD